MADDATARRFREELEVIDAEGRPVKVGSRVGGDCLSDGEVVELRTEDDNDGAAPTVVVEWPGLDGSEVFGTVPRDYRREGPSGPYVWRCDDIEVRA